MKRSVLKRRSRLRPVNPERKRKRAAADLVYGSHHEAIRRFSCVLEGHPLHVCGFFADRPGIEGHHLKGVGAGGRDRDNEIPLCPVGHDEMHAKGSIFAACKWMMRDLKSMACEHTRLIDKHTSEEP